MMVMNLMGQITSCRDIGVTTSGATLRHPDAVKPGKFAQLCLDSLAAAAENDLKCVIKTIAHRGGAPGRRRDHIRPLPGNQRPGPEQGHHQGRGAGVRIIKPQVQSHSLGTD